MLRRLIIFLTRLRLGLKKREKFIFVNQNDRSDFYYFTETNLIKVSCGFKECLSNVSLNWLLNKKCSINSLDRLKEKNYGKI